MNWQTAKNFIQSIYDWLYPPLPECMWCGKEYWPEDEIPFCQDCLLQVPVISGRQCLKCSRPLRLAAARKDFCFLCEHHTYFFTRVKAATLYDGIIKQLLHRLKYYGQVHLGQRLGSLLVERIKWEYVWYSYDLILPIPLAAAKYKERGYNQAAILARAVANYLKRPYSEEILVRIKETLSQNQLSLAERRKNLYGAFMVTQPMKITGKKILLIDDIFTSGATISSAAWILLKNGARRVDGLTLALGVLPEQWLTKNPKV